MTDQQLRATEREHAAGVASEDAVLTARLRAGTLTSRRVELAAYCGHAPSWRVTEPPMRKVVNGLTCCCGSDERDSEHNSIENYTHGFVHACEHYGTECTCDVTEHWAPAWREPVPNSFAKWLKGLHGRFATEVEHDVAMTLSRVAGARLALEAWTGPFQSTALEAALEAAATWATCPCERHAQAWAEAFVVAAPPPLGVAWLPVPPPTARLSRFTIAGPRRNWSMLPEEAVTWNDRLPLAALCCVVGAGTPTNLPRQYEHGGVVRAAMETALIAWALA